MRILLCKLTSTKGHLKNVSSRSEAVIPECLCREPRKSHGNGFPTEAFGNDGLCAYRRIYGIGSRQLLTSFSSAAKNPVSAAATAADSSLLKNDVKNGARIGLVAA